LNQSSVAGHQSSVRSAAIATSISLCILVALGVWQLQRLHWKEAMLADIDRAERGPAATLRGTPGRFAKVSTRGVLRAPAALYGAFVRPTPDGRELMGADRLQVLDRPDGPPVLVDLGWVPTEGLAPPVATGPVRVEGYARDPEHPRWFSAEDDPSAHRFYTLDPAVIAASLGRTPVAPFTLVAMGPATDRPPIPATALPRPPNNHLQYAFTWFGLAASLVAVFIAWTRGRPA
jgi:surfeit locus 1 family protein